MCPLPFQDDGQLLIESSVLQRAFSFRQARSVDCETGGILLGFRRGPHLHVCDLTVPQRGDLRRRYGFQRNDGQHQAIAIARWKDSAHCMDYLGEWHTHPELDPSPSSLDKSEWKKIAEHANQPMVFLIAGTEYDFWLGVGSKRKLATMLKRTSVESMDPSLQKHHAN